MKYLLVCLSAIICPIGGAYSGRIYGGQNATSGQYPFMAALNDYHQFCNGVIISPSWILTTSHCTYYTSASAEVYVGSHINHADGTAYRFFERVTHRDYDDWTLQNDIALIRINAVLEYSDTIQPIELGTSPTANSTCTIIGWGTTEVANDPPSLQYVDATAMDLDSCQTIADENFSTYYLGPEQVCTVSSAGQGACLRDNGGALFCDGKLAGIFSYTVGSGCGVGLPGVFTGVENYSDWIRSFIER